MWSTGCIPNRRLLQCVQRALGDIGLDRSSEQEFPLGRAPSAGVEKPKVAAIGCGHWGKNIIRNLSQLGALSAVSDLSATVAAEFSARYEVPARPFRELLEDDEIGAVAIATPASLHAEHVRP